MSEGQTLLFHCLQQQTVHISVDFQCQQVKSFFLLTVYVMYASGPQLEIYFSECFLPPYPTFHFPVPSFLPPFTITTNDPSNQARGSGRAM